MKCYSELMRLKTFEERYHYLQLRGTVGKVSFGWERYINQKFYRSYEWKHLRTKIIARDGGNDLAMEGYPIPDRGRIHHINPLTIEQFLERDPLLLDPENLILVSHNTHNAIHYGDESLLPKDPVVRRPNDQCPWLT